MGCNSSKEIAKAKDPPTGPRLVQVPQFDQEIETVDTITSEPPKKTAKAKHPPTGFRVVQIHPDPVVSKTETDIDIIAIHGLDTKSPDTCKVGKARIFTCDWPAEMFESTKMARKRIQELARRLIDAIKRRDPPNNENRPILFIASCLGGIILVKALLDTIDNDPIRSSTRGVIFLATPFWGTAFDDIAHWARCALEVSARCGRKRLTSQDELIAGPTFDMSETVHSFSRLQKKEKYYVFTFYEKGLSNIYRKAIPSLPSGFSGSKVLVDKPSGTLPTEEHPIGLDRKHGLMNKFKGPEDEDYQTVAGKVEKYLELIREGTPFQRMDKELKKYYLSLNRLLIDRLFGHMLKMDNKPKAILSFLTKHQLMQSLIRIPILLDALCWTWDEFDFRKAPPQTMTAIYNTIASKLLKKDRETFSEYFAARYFVRKWKANEDLKFVDLTSGEEQCMKPSVFLGNKKYSARYDVVWRFVAGLLDSGRGPKEPERFFRILDQKPLDLLGIAHQRLFMNCLSETQSKFSLRSDIEGHLSKWLAFQCEVILEQGQRSLRESVITLATEIEFPENSLLDLLEGTDEEVMMVVFFSMKKRRQIQPQIMKIALSLLQITESNDVAMSIFALFRQERENLSEEHLDLLASYLEKKAHGDIINSAADTMRAFALPERICRRIIAKRSYKTFQAYGGVALRDQKLSKEILTDLIASLESEKKNIRRIASDVLSQQSDLLPEQITSITEKIKFCKDDIKLCSIKALGGQSHSLETFTGLLWTEASESSTRFTMAASEVLCRLSKFSEDLLDRIIIDLLPNRYLWAKIKACCCNRPGLSKKVLNALGTHLESPDYGLRCTALEILAKQADLSVSILDRIVGLLEDDSKKIEDDSKKIEDDKIMVKTAAIYAISCQSRLPIKTSLKIAAKFERDELPADFVLQAFEHQSNSPKEVLVRIASCIENQDSSIRRAAICALSSQSYLLHLPKILERVIKYIGDSNAEVREAAIKAVSVVRQPMLKTTFDKIAARINDPDEMVRLAVVGVLGQQKSLSNGILRSLVDLMNNPDSNVRWATLKTLADQETWPKAIRDKLALQVHCPQAFRGVSFDWMFNKLVEREEFHYNFLLGGLSKQNLRLLLLRTSRTHLAWYIENGMSHVEIGQSSKKPVLCVGSDIEAGMMSAREDAGIPPVAVLDS
ncbi:NACHT protein [Penicillium brevicompactum]